MVRKRRLILEAALACCLLVAGWVLILPRFQSAQLMGRVTARYLELQSVADAFVAYELDHGLRLPPSLQPSSPDAMPSGMSAETFNHLPATRSLRAALGLGDRIEPVACLFAVSVEPMESRAAARSLSPVAPHFGFLCAVAAPVPRDTLARFRYDYLFPRGAGPGERISYLRDECFDSSNGLNSKGVIMTWATARFVQDGTSIVPDR